MDDKQPSDSANSRRRIACLLVRILSKVTVASHNKGRPSHRMPSPAWQSLPAPRRQQHTVCRPCIGLACACASWIWNRYSALQEHACVAGVSPRRLPVSFAKARQSDFCGFLLAIELKADKLRTGPATTPTHTAAVQSQSRCFRLALIY